jgi:hypothetical protein
MFVILLLVGRLEVIVLNFRYYLYLYAFDKFHFGGGLVEVRWRCVEV